MLWIVSKIIISTKYVSRCINILYLKSPCWVIPVQGKPSLIIFSLDWSTEPWTWSALWMGSGEEWETPPGMQRYKIHLCLFPRLSQTGWEFQSRSPWGNISVIHLLEFEIKKLPNSWGRGLFPLPLISPFSPLSSSHLSYFRRNSCQLIWKWEARSYEGCLRMQPQQFTKSVC